jgi:hypothetical protein
MAGDHGRALKGVGKGRCGTDSHGVTSLKGPTIYPGIRSRAISIQAPRQVVHLPSTEIQWKTMAGDIIDSPDISTWLA